jgi:hypothetical protein
MKSIVAAGLMLILCGGGCAMQQATAPAPPPAQAPAHALPFKGRLLDGDANRLPPAVAMSLDRDSQVTFLYREEISHDDYHIPLAVTAFDPATYIGAPVGDLGVTAFASLSITEGDRVLGDYTAKVHMSKSYTLYKEPTHSEVEEAARAAVREKIDQKLYRDEERLAAAVAGAKQRPQAVGGEPNVAAPAQPRPVPPDPPPASPLPPSSVLPDGPAADAPSAGRR